MKSTFKKAIAAIVASTTIVTPVSAYSEAAYVPSEISDYIEYANIWASNAYDEEVSIDELIEVVDANGDNAGYCISFADNDIPMGYILVDLKDTQYPVKEFALSGLNLYDEIYNTFSDTNIVSRQRINYNTNICKSDSKTIHCISSADYAIDVSLGDSVMKLTTDGELFDDMSYDSYIDNLVENNQAFIANHTSVNARISNADGMLDSLSGTSLYTKNITGLNNFSVLADDDFTNNKCLFISGTNILYYWQSIRGKSGLMTGSGNSMFDATYNRLKTFREANGSMPNAFEAYCDEKNYTVTSGSYGKASTTFDEIRSEIDQNNPVMIYLRSDAPVDHAVVGCGVTIYAVSGGPHFYVRIMDGWNKNANRYIEPSAFYTEVEAIYIHFE